MMVGRSLFYFRKTEHRNDRPENFKEYCWSREKRSSENCNSVFEVERVAYWVTVTRVRDLERRLCVSTELFASG
jgi:hypothetical protein